MLYNVIKFSQTKWLLQAANVNTGALNNNKIFLNTTALVNSHHTLLEIVWTIVPALILYCVVMPSFALIYAMDEIICPEMTVKIIGRQWYWTYEMSDPVPALWTVNPSYIIDPVAKGDTVITYERRDIFGVTTFFSEVIQKKYLALIEKSNLAKFCDIYVLFPELAPHTLDVIKSENPNASTALILLSDLQYGKVFDSAMLTEEDLPLGAFRLLEVDNKLVLPTETHIRFLITASDVIHSWAVPSLGIKMDAIPGRLNQIMSFIKREGVFFGQCSEICGINHSFMPIVVVAVSPDNFIDWRWPVLFKKIILFPGS